MTQTTKKERKDTKEEGRIIFYLKKLRKYVINNKKSNKRRVKKMSNPYAEVFYNEFKKQFINSKHAQENAQTPRKIESFVAELNNFLSKAAPEKNLKIDTTGYKIEAKEFANYVLSLRANMIAHSKDIKEIKEKDSRSKEIIEFLDKVKDFCINSSSKLYEDFDYDCFQLNKNSQELELYEDLPNTNSKSLYFFGVNRSNRDNLKDINYYFKHATKDLFQDKIFADTDIYSVSMPTCFPEEIAGSSILKTITEPERFNDAEKYFVEEYWSGYIGKDLEFDEEGKVVGGKKFAPQLLKKRMQNLKIFSYCAGAANAHRCLKALKNIALQIYDKPTVEEAWKNIDVVSYAFPLESEKIDYKNTAIMCNDKNPDNPESVILTNFPSQYKELRLSKQDKGSIKIKNQNNCKYIALELPKDVPIFDHNGQQISRHINNRNGHRLQNATAKNIYSHNYEVLSYIMESILKQEEINDKKLQQIANSVNIPQQEKER